jgi:glycosyltransferase involved in cell wall biosynthesis
LSVISQKYPNLEYIVMDGGSTDGSADIIRKYEKQISFWESQPDLGLYDALQKGFLKSSGEIMGWLNSDDILHSNSLFSVAALFSVNPEISWIQGYPTVIDEQNRIVFQRLPVYSKLFHYLKDYKDGRFIQQESTFWKRSLWNRAGGYVSQEYKFAGDFELWIRFFDHSRLFTTSAILGAFRVRKNGQLSSINYGEYLAECDKIIDRNEPFLSEKEHQNILYIKRLREIQKNPQSGAVLPVIQHKISEFLFPPQHLSFNGRTYSFEFDY